MEITPQRVQSQNIATSALMEIGLTYNEVYRLSCLALAAVVCLNNLFWLSPSDAAFFQDAESYLATNWSAAAPVVTTIAVAYRSWLIVSVFSKLVQSYNAYREGDSWKDSFMSVIQVAVLLGIGDLITTAII